eukprot:TRINITY_DN902_c0_g1_i12.p2 TRINITY_DN902_c0_g1~~TRINITY_DN902_c0_g1_i12.p2  ORF type:complete len:161 (-),score=100.29 TRINITY_DN902_c0_g1_i12:1127-1609(-)
MSAFPNELEQEYRSAFDFFDEKQRIVEQPAKKGQPIQPTHPGQLSPRTMRVLMRSLGEDAADNELTSMCSSGGLCDVNGFLSNRRAKWERAHCIDTVKEAFRCFDEDDSGLINAEAVKDALVRYGDRLAPNEADEFVREANGSGGRFNYNQFSEQLLQKQ